MSPLALRTARSDERQALEDLQRRASLVYAEYRAPLLANPGAIHLPQEQLDARRVRAAERGGKVLGFCVVLPRDAAACDLDGLFVEPGCWKQGVGRALMEDAFARSGTAVMTVLSNPHAEAFYARLGFVCTGTVQTSFGIGLKMQRNCANLTRTGGHFTPRART